ncbi:hypothetical protein MTBSS4_130016 [Magnetospirillum sp. SS-4]|nr:hypothetical protein MTBSS4_130016 [Magnetospirillum sp. SS-4]
MVAECDEMYSGREADGGDGAPYAVLAPERRRRRRRAGGGYGGAGAGLVQDDAAGRAGDDDGAFQQQDVEKTVQRPAPEAGAAHPHRGQRRTHRQRVAGQSADHAGFQQERSPVEMQRRLAFVPGGNPGEILHHHLGLVGQRQLHAVGEADQQPGGGTGAQPVARPDDAARRQDAAAAGIHRLGPSLHPDDVAGGLGLGHGGKKQQRHDHGQDRNSHRHHSRRIGSRLYLVGAVTEIKIRDGGFRSWRTLRESGLAEFDLGQRIGDDAHGAGMHIRSSRRVNHGEHHGEVCADR